MAQPEFKSLLYRDIAGVEAYALSIWEFDACASAKIFQSVDIAINAYDAIRKGLKTTLKKNGFQYDALWALMIVVRRGCCHLRRVRPLHSHLGR